MRGVQLAHDYSVLLGMPKIQSEITIYIYHDTAKLIYAYARETNSSMEHARTHWEGSRGIGIAIAFKNHFFVNVSNEGYQNTEPKYRTKVIAHEFIHTYQNELSELRSAAASHEVPEAGPRWLQEGIAEYLAYKSLSEGGILSYESERNRFVSSAKRVDKPLSEMETQEGYRGVSYNYFLIAAELLAKTSGERNLLKYHALQDSKTTWQEAFEKSFGMTVDKFYELFEEHRAAGFPDPAGPTPTPTPAGAQTVDDYIVWKIGDEVSPTVEAEAREAVLTAHDFAVGLGMPHIDHPITIYLYRNLGSLEAAFEAATGHEFEDRVGPDFAAGADPIMASRDFIALNTSAEGYREQSPNQHKDELVNHLFDVYRIALTGIWQYTPHDAVPPEGPAWLLSGASRFLTHQVLRAPGPESCDPTRARYASQIQGGDTPLSELETWADSYSVQSSGAYGFLALEVLAEQSGPESIIGYFASLRPGVAWQEEFRTNFGMTVEEFYQLFEELRAAGFPDWDCSSARQPSTPTGLPLVAMPGVPHYLRWYIGPNVPQVYVEEMKKGGPAGA